MKTKHKTGGMLPWLSATAAWLAAPLAVLLAAGCSANEPEAGTEVAGIPVSVGVHVSATAGQTVVTRAAEGMNSPTTRAGADVNNETTGLAAGDQFYALLTGTTVDATTYTTAAGGAATPGVQPYLKQNAGSTGATIRAYYPWRIGGTDGAPNASPSLATFTVSQDQSSDAGYRLSDLMYAPSTAINTTTGQATLTFEHRMAKVVVAVDNRISATVTAVNLVQGYRTVNLKTPAELVPYAAGETGAALSDPVGQSEPLRVMAGGTSAAATVSAAALLPPQTIRKSRRFIEVQTDKGTAYFAFGDTDQTLASGTEYTATCRLDRAALSATVSEVGWTVGTTITTETQQENLVFTVGTATFQMNFVKGGAYTTFLGKSVTGTLSDYYLGQTEVTQVLWKAVMGGLLHSDGTALADQNVTGDNYPLSNMSHTDVATFLTKLNTAAASHLPTGYSFQLPSEAQWEYAARGGQYSQNIAYTTQATLDQYEWSLSNSDNKKHPVAQLKPNELGLYDMLGNIQELTADYCTAGSGTVLSTTTNNPDQPNVSDGQDLGHDYQGQTTTTTNGTYERGGSYGNNLTDNYGYAVRLDRHHQFTMAHVHVGLRLALVRIP